MVLMGSGGDLINTAIHISSGLNEKQPAGTELTAADVMASLFGSALCAQLLMIGDVAGIITSWNTFTNQCWRRIYRECRHYRCRQYERKENRYKKEDARWICLSMETLPFGFKLRYVESH
ncbi:hypothetical protein ACE1TI_00555 [Alteribacillus sp. JSM 102045]|uniref:hypothetical protein n=1 Tax=Alteribacillus sp. JSM 102045 TaxID=1562101 RepID=UPI0035C19D74